MENLIRVSVLRDDSGHWFVIPAIEEAEFHRLLDLEEEGEEEFIKRFSSYMTGGSINLIELYAEV